MAKPGHYTSKVAIPLPSDEAVRRIIGNSYNPEKTLNVVKMFAGTEDRGNDRRTEGGGGTDQTPRTRWLSTSDRPLAELADELGFGAHSNLMSFGT